MRSRSLGNEILSLMKPILSVFAQMHILFSRNRYFLFDTFIIILF